MVERRVSADIPWMVMMKKPTQHMNSMDVSGMVSSFSMNSNKCHKYQFLRDLFSLTFTGCLKCYARNTENAVSGQTMHDLHQATMQKTLYLKERGFNVVEVWECDIKRELEQDEEMRRYFDNYDLTDPLEPRDAFFGGRTNAAKLFHECEEDEKIRCVV